jgi:replicative DNA helicase
LSVPVLLAVQRTRTARRRDDPIPQLDDADAPTLETDSDGAWRIPGSVVADDEQAEPESRRRGLGRMGRQVRRAKGTAKIIALKVRSGQPFESGNSSGTGKCEHDRQN